MKEKAKEDSTQTKEDSSESSEDFGNEEEKESSSSGYQQEEPEKFKATCAECGKEAEVPFKPEDGRPVYCKDCYQKRRPPRRSFGGGGGNRFGGGRGRQDRRPREMHKTTCSSCGKEAEVPFKPDGRKPVLCKECFMKKRESETTAA